MAEPERLLVVLGDQLDANAPLLRESNPARDAVWMCECAFEADKVWSHKARIALFLAAMRHFAEALRSRGWTVHYRRIGTHAHSHLGEALAEDLRTLKPTAVAMTEAGEWDVAKEIRATVNAAGLSLETLEDEHFLCSRAAFADWLADRKQPRMEHFYRVMRRESGLLLEGSEPAGGRWNFCLLYTSPSPRDLSTSRMPSSA